MRYIRQPIVNGQSALHRAVVNSAPVASFHFLLGLMPPDPRDAKGRTPLHTAIGYESIAVAEALLEHHADPRLTDHNGTSPTDLARFSENGPIFLGLILLHLPPSTAAEGGAAADAFSLRSPFGGRTGQSTAFLAASEEDENDGLGTEEPGSKGSSGATFG